MNDRLLMLLLTCTLGLAACATGPQKSVDASGSEMLGLAEDPKHPVWDDWTPAPEPSVSRGVLEPLYAFDYWQLDQSEYIESIWAAVSTLIDSVRRQSEDQDVRDAATLMLEALEPGQASPLVVDATFYVTDDREGVALRFLRKLDAEGSASFVLMFGRSADGGSEPDRIRLLATPGFEEPTAFGVDMRKAEGAWVAKIESDAAGAEKVPGVTLDEADLYAAVLVSQTWRPLTGAEYANARMRREQAEELPAPFRPALGLEVGDRDIDRVFTNSVFIPRMDDFSPDG